MITVQISGGLGNQLFQYAFARSLKEKNGFEVKLETSFYQSQSPEEARREYLLDRFNISLTKVGNKGKTGHLISRLVRKLTEIEDKFRHGGKKKIVRENGYVFDAKALSPVDGSYLMGVWQSPKYWTGLEHVIQKEITLKYNLPSEAAKIKHEITSTPDTVSIHVRRGDYVTRPNTNSLHGVCGTDYYEKAMEVIEKKTKDPVFFVFSDDIEWAKKNILTNYKIHFVSGTGLSSTDELILMSLCDHNIIANSTFSWWGSWLNKNPHKTVIAPKNWFQVSHLDTKDLIPQDWITL